MDQKLRDLERCGDLARNPILLARFGFRPRKYRIEMIAKGKRSEYKGSGSGYGYGYGSGDGSGS